MKNSQGSKDVICKQCNKEFSKSLVDIEKTNNNNFCSRSCSATYNGKNKLRANGKYVVVEKNCINCSKSYFKDSSSDSDVCSRICFMEFGMKHRYMKDAIKRKRS